MHEMGIALQIVEIASAAIPEDRPGVPVEAVNVRLGKLSTVVPDSLRFCFDAAIQGTVRAAAS